MRHRARCALRAPTDARLAEHAQRARLLLPRPVAPAPPAHSRADGRTSAPSLTQPSLWARLAHATMTKVRPSRLARRASAPLPPNGPVTSRRSPLQGVGRLSPPLQRHREGVRGRCVARTAIHLAPASSVATSITYHPLTPSPALAPPHSLLRYPSLSMKPCALLLPSRPSLPCFSM